MDSLYIPKNPAGRRAWIVYQLRLKGLSLRRLSLSLGLGESTTRAALRTPYPRMERVIADAIGVPAATIWPERYDAAGRPLSGYGARGIGRPPNRLKDSGRPAIQRSVSTEKKRCANGHPAGAGRRSKRGVAA